MGKVQLDEVLAYPNVREEGNTLRTSTRIDGHHARAKNRSN